MLAYTTLNATLAASLAATILNAAPDFGFSRNESVSKIRVVIWKMFYLYLFTYIVY